MYTSSYTLNFWLRYNSLINKNNNGKSSIVNKQLVSSSKTTTLYPTFGRFLCHPLYRVLFPYITEPEHITVTLKVEFLYNYAAMLF